MKKSFIIFLAVSIAFIFAGQAQAATNFSISPVKINVKEGESFRVNISVNPHGVMNYTVKSSIKFPADLVVLKTWSYAGNWMPLRQSGYDYFSNSSGVLIRTAGYPEGFDKVTSLGSAVFVATKSGSGVIEFAGDSMALDENSSNMFAGGNQLAIIVSPMVQIKPPSEAPTPTPATVIPTPEEPTSTLEIVSSSVGEVVEQLFDITLGIDSRIINKSSDLVARTEFSSFGTVPTPVNMVYRIEDAGSKVVYTDTGEVTVETEKIVTKEFINLNLSDGKYTLILATTYGENIKDEFKQAFEVKSVPVQVKKGLAWAWIVSILIIGGIGACIIIYQFIKHKRKK
ncbi:MAG: hypothetical protein NTW66_00675 [Candidatus Magasanikbacteria bacterium]|nr:hypothetical protein [Candidatus Magasanikbacteria bacterium]